MTSDWEKVAQVKRVRSFSLVAVWVAHVCVCSTSVCRPRRAGAGRGKQSGVSPGEQSDSSCLKLVAWAVVVTEAEVGWTGRL